MKIIQISGKIGSGKDTVADLMHSYIDELSHDMYDIERVNFASKLKEVGAIMLNVDVDLLSNREFKNSYLDRWEMTVREFLQKLGTEAVRNSIHDDGWVIQYVDQIKYLFKEKELPLVVFTTDLRMRNEKFKSVEWLKEDIPDVEAYQIRILRSTSLIHWFMMDNITLSEESMEYLRKHDYFEEPYYTNEYIEILDVLLTIIDNKEDLHQLRSVYNIRTHFSETNLDDVGLNYYDFVIDNDKDLNKLSEECDRIVRAIFSSGIQNT